MLPEELGQAKAQGEGGGKDQPSIGHQAVVVEGDLDAVGVVTWYHLSGAPFLGPAVDALHNTTYGLIVGCWRNPPLSVPTSDPLVSYSCWKGFRFFLLFLTFA